MLTKKCIYYNLDYLNKLISNYNHFLITEKLLGNKNVKIAKEETKNLILDLFNNPDDFNFDERFYIFRNKKNGQELFSSYVFAILKQSNETSLYLKLYEKTY